MKKKIIFISSILLVIDLITKFVINSTLELYESKNIITNFFAITRIYNDGASWNIFSGQRLILILVSVIILIILIKYSQSFKQNMRNTLAFGFLYSGILGNLIERILFGHVTDYLDFTFWNYDYPVFNLADVFIICGLILLVIAIIKKEDISGISSRSK